MLYKILSPFQSDTGGRSCKGNWVGFKPGYTAFYATDETLRWERKEFEWEHQLEPEHTLERERIEKQLEFKTAGSTA